MNDTGAEAMGLRARKRLATREALTTAAVQLAVKRGPANVRVEDIAAAAGVSPRTYNNYFSSREEAICALRADQTRRIASAFRARPADEPLDEAVIHAMAEQLFGGTEPDQVAMGMIASTPALRGEFLKSIAAIEMPLAEVLAERTGTDAQQDLLPQVLAAAVSSAARVAILDWLRPGSTAPFAAVLRDALTQIAPAMRAADRGASGLGSRRDPGFAAGCLRRTT